MAICTGAARAALAVAITSTSAARSMIGPCPSPDPRSMPRGRGGRRRVGCSPLRPPATRRRRPRPMGFLFVDRIEALDEHGARGHLDLMPGEAALPPWLILEAVGQLAAWIAMARTNFLSRPVAALVGEALLDSSAWCDRADGPVELAAQLERIDGRAILYTGSASCGGRVIASLSRCVGPLLPVALFDDPEVVRERLGVLRHGGGPVRRIPPPAFPVATAITVDAVGARHAHLRVPY